MILKFLKKNAYEGYVVSAIIALIVTTFLRGGMSQMSNKEFAFQKFYITVIVFFIVFAAFTVMYYVDDAFTRVILLMCVFIFSIVAAFYSDSTGWSDLTNNPIGKACFLALLCVITVFTYFYVKKDVFDIAEKIHVSNRCVKITAAVTAAALFGIIAAVGILRYKTFSASSFDFGIAVQMYQNMLKTGTMNTVVERSTYISHLAVHFCPIYYLGLPLYFLLPYPETVQAIQAIMLALPVIPIVLLCRKYNMANKMTIGMVLLYALYPATVCGTFYDIHETCFLVFMILMAVWAAEKNRNILVIIFCFLTCICKEDAPIYIAVLGLYYLVSKRHRKMGVAMTICAVIAFGIEVAIVNSYGLGTLNDRFGNLTENNSFISIIWTVLGNPGYMLTQTVSNASSVDIMMDKIQYFILMFVPVAAALFSTKKHYARYILLFPMILTSIITTYQYTHDITFHYNYGSIAFIMFVIIMNLKDMNYKKACSRISVCVLCAAIMFTGMAAVKLQYYTDLYSEKKSIYADIDYAIEEYVPEDAVVVTTSFLQPHIYKNLKVYSITYLDIMFDYSEIDYVVVDERSGGDEFDSLLESGEFEEVYMDEYIVSVYKRIE